jgi:hypothetical protein
MKTRHILCRLAVALSIALFLPPRSRVSAEEPGTLSFLKVGSSYHVTYSGATVRNTVKILEPAGGQWFRVEIVTTGRLVSPGVAEARATPDQKPYERWINFANVVSVNETKEPDKKEPEKK